MAEILLEEKQVPKKKRTLNIYWILIGLCLAAMLYVGLNSDVFLGDEVHHYRFAKENFHVGGRALYDGLYGPVIPPGYLFASEPVWPLGLSSLWRITGSLDLKNVAQFYQLGFVALYIFSIYFLAKELYGKACAQDAAFLAATMPMAVSFGILFYVDLPAAAFCALAFLMIARKRYFWAGLFVGTAYLTKRSGFFFLPAAGLFILTEKASFYEKMKMGFLFSLGALLLVIPDIFWRNKVLYAAHIIPQRASDALPLPFPHAPLPMAEEFRNSVHTAFERSWGMIRERIAIFNPMKFWQVKEKLNSSLLNPKDILSYFGVPFLVLFPAYFLRRNFSRRDFFLWMPLVVFVMAYIFIFHLGSDIRYIFPAVPLLVIIAAKSFEGIGGIWRKMLVMTAVLQVLAACFFVYQTRRPTPAVRESFAYIRENIPADAVVMYPEANMVEWAQRKIIWGLGGILNLFWVEDEHHALPLIRLNKLRYIIIKKNRIYDDQNGTLRHYSGYPKSFVDRLPQWSIVEPVFENSEIKIWKIHSERNV